ncbi:MAG: hypothetical protein HY286_05250 [Planctomycetes bacterium]|nr:hypothetical protein [Planctomycetota bacterium]
MHSVNPETLSALLDLLRDHSPSVVAAAREKLVSLGEPAVVALRKAAAGDDARLRVRARAALFDIRQAAAVESLLQYAALPAELLQLEEGAFRIAQIEFPDLQRAPYVAILDSLGDQSAARVSAFTTPIDAAGEFGKILAKECRLQLNQEHFDEPDNSFIHRVLDRRRGIPISLATIYLCVAQRAGLRLAGIGTPGHFLLRYGPPDWDVYMDPATGSALRLEACIRMLTVRGFPVAREHFEPVAPREIFSRMCANLVGAYERRRSQANTARWARLRDAFRDRNPKPGKSGP